MTGDIPRGPTRSMGGSRSAFPPNGSELHAWLYNLRSDGTCHLTWNGYGSNKESLSAKIVPPTAMLRVSVDEIGDTPHSRHLRAPAAVGMAFEPVTVSPDPDTGHWKIRNHGRTNTLRVQPYGLRAVPLRPSASMAMPGADVAVWIPFVPHGSTPENRNEAFRLLILHAPEPVRAPGETRNITDTRIRALTEAMREAVIMFFGEYLTWPPLPTPHVRQESEVKDIAQSHNLLATKGAHWVRNRNEVLSGRDGMFITSEAGRWYPPLGGSARSAGHYLPAFQRLVELGAVTSSMVRRWADQLNVEAYVSIDQNLLR
jgi:hypothetical protein